MKNVYKVLFVLLLIIINTFLLSADVFAQKTYNNFDLKKHFTLELLNLDISNNIPIEIIWIDSNRLLLKSERTLYLILNIQSNSPFVMKLTDFLLVQKDGNTTSFYYIEELDYIIYAEERPNISIRMYTGKGLFVDELDIKANKNCFKLNYVKLSDVFIMLIGNSLYFVRNKNNYEKVADNIHTYIYNRDSNNLLVYKNLSDFKLSNTQNYQISLINLFSFKETIINNNSSFADFITGNIIYYVNQTTINLNEVFLINISNKDNEINELFSIKNISIESYLNGNINNNYLFLSNKPKIVYDNLNELFIYTCYEEDSKLKTLYIVDKNNKQVFNPIQNVSDFFYNYKTNYIILIYPKSANLYRLETRNITKWNEYKIISEELINYNKNFKFDLDSNCLNYLERHGDKNNIILYDITNHKKLTLLVTEDIIEYVKVNLKIDNNIFLTYKTESLSYNTNIYTRNSELVKEFNNTSYIVPYSLKEIAVIENINNITELCIYLNANIENTSLKPFSIGFKGGGQTTFVSTFSEMPNIGYDVSLFFNYRFFNSFLVELGIVWIGRQYSFDPKYVAGEDPSLISYLTVKSNIIGIQTIFNYVVPIFNMDFYMLAGFEFSFSLDNTLYRKLVTGGGYYENVNDDVGFFGLDVITGLGLYFYQSKYVSFFTEIIISFGIFSPYQNSYLMEYLWFGDYPFYFLDFQIVIGSVLFRF